MYPMRERVILVLGKKCFAEILKLSELCLRICGKKFLKSLEEDEVVDQLSKCKVLWAQVQFGKCLAYLMVF